MSGYPPAMVGVLLDNSEGTAAGRGTKDLGTAFPAAASGGAVVAGLAPIHGKGGIENAEGR